jgi:hypothetical protein
MKLLTEEHKKLTIQEENDTIQAQTENLQNNPHSTALKNLKKHFTYNGYNTQ